MASAGRRARASVRGYRKRAVSASGLDRVGTAWQGLPERVRSLAPVVIVIALAVTYPFYVESLPTNIPVILTFPPLHDAVTIPAISRTSQTEMWIPPEFDAMPTEPKWKCTCWNWPEASQPHV